MGRLMPLPAGRPVSSRPRSSNQLSLMPCSSEPPTRRSGTTDPDQSDRRFPGSDHRMDGREPTLCLMQPARCIPIRPETPSRAPLCGSSRWSRRPSPGDGARRWRCRGGADERPSVVTGRARTWPGRRGWSRRIAGRSGASDWRPWTKPDPAPGPLPSWSCPC